MASLPRPSRPSLNPPTTPLPSIPDNKRAGLASNSANGSRAPSSASSALPQPPSRTVSGSSVPTSGSGSGGSNSTTTSPLSAAPSQPLPSLPAGKTLRKTTSYNVFPKTSNASGQRPPSVHSSSSTSTTPRNSVRGSIASGVALRNQVNPASSRIPGSKDQSPVTPSSATFKSPLVPPTIVDSSKSDPGGILEESHEDDSSRGRQSMSGSKDKGNVVISVRVRPEPVNNDGSTAAGEWMVDGRQSLIAYKGREGGDYYYDNVFTAHDKNAKVYDSSAKRLVRRVMEGYHGTVFAYGMTGTGKTFSMQGTATSPGVIPLAITDIFSFIRETPHREFLLRVSYLEIYNEKIHDLLSVPLAANGQAAVQQQDEIKLREDSKRGVYATPLKEEIVQSPTQLLRVIARGDHARRTSSTQYNARSSRSHAVVQIVVESRERQSAGGLATPDSKRAGITPGGVRVSTLSLIDLAGSERAAENKERRAEGAHINKSLLTLGTVVSRLSSNKDKTGQPTDKDGKHLPYRDSKLTRLLQPALSGNSLISILCTIQIGATGSVAAVGTHIGENLNTLKFAARARNNIVSHAKKAEEAHANIGDAGSRALLDRYRIEIQDLRKQLEGQKVENDKAKDEAEEKQREQEQEQRHEEQMLEMQLARTALKERIGHLNRLILSSKSIGVNAGRISSSASTIQQRGSAFSTASQTRSVKSSASAVDPNDTSRRTSSGSTATAGPGNQPVEGAEAVPDAQEDDEVDESLDSGEGSATLNSQVKNLQADLADKNRYIATLEKRLLQARRSSRSRLSAQLGNHRVSSPIAEDREDSNMDSILQEKDSEIAELRARLDDKERMVAALRSAARKRDTADTRPTNTPPGDHTSVTSAEAVANGSSSSNKRSSISSHVSSANASDNRRSSINTVPKSSTSIDRGQPQSPASPVGRLMQLSGGNSPKREVKKTHGVDEMTRMLDEMIRQKVESGGGGSLPHSRAGGHTPHASGSTNGARSSNETQRQVNGVVNSRAEPPSASSAAVAASKSQPHDSSARALRRRSAEPNQMDGSAFDAEATPRSNRSNNIPPTGPINTQISPSSTGPSSPLPPIPTHNSRPSLSTIASSSKGVSISPSQASSSNVASPALSIPPSSVSNSNSNTPSSFADVSRSPSDTVKSSPTVPPFGETRTPASASGLSGEDDRPLTAVPPVPKVDVERVAGSGESVESRQPGYGAGSSALMPPQSQQSWLRRERDESPGGRSDGTAIADEVQDEGPDGKRLSAYGASSSSFGQSSTSQRSSVGLGIETRS